MLELQKEEILSKFKKENKILFMKFLGKDECEICGYDKSLDSLNFHHTEPENKTIDFRLFRNKISNIDDIIEHVRKELLSCQVICRNCNCHAVEHCDSEFFENYKNLIYEKSKTFKGNQSKLSVQIVMEMYNKGTKQIDIAKYFNASKGTISGIIKKNKQKLSLDI